MASCLFNSSMNLNGCARRTTVYGCSSPPPSANSPTRGPGGERLRLYPQPCLTWWEALGCVRLREVSIRFHQLLHTRVLFVFVVGGDSKPNGGTGPPTNTNGFSKAWKSACARRQRGTWCCSVLTLVLLFCAGLGWTASPTSQNTSGRGQQPKCAHTPRSFFSARKWQKLPPTAPTLEPHRLQPQLLRCRPLQRRQRRRMSKPLILVFESHKTQLLSPGLQPCLRQSLLWLLLLAAVPQLHSPRRRASRCPACSRMYSTQ